ncbi:MAG: hypothetical protein J5I91_01680 [Bacteroidetes bacterium]|nr:hypothetical protein [Bacteroidota bacterium]
MSLKLIEEFIEKTSKLKIAVVGETIIDEFVTVYYEGHSMKSFCPVFREADRNIVRQRGGSSAIYNHIKAFAGHVDLFTNPEDSIIKTRLVDAHDGKKHVEYNKFHKDDFEPIKIDCNDYDAVIVADFGHGLSDFITINDGFYLMSQTNSNNFGFNRLSKWKNYKKRGVCVDLREASLQINRKISQCTDKDVREIFDYELQTESLFVTLGAEGSIYTNGKEIYRHQSFKTQIVDTIGAGDTFYSFAVLADTICIPNDNKLLIPSLSASLSTTWLCNEQSVTPEKLIEHANRYL